jgi:hypothetical protein
VLSDTCGTWLLFNDLYGVTPFVDFCKVTGNVCNEQGSHLILQLVSGVFPAAKLSAAFQQIAMHRLQGDNPCATSL